MNKLATEEIKNGLKDILISVADFDLKKEDIEDGENSIKKLGFNSLALIRMLVEIENVFGAEIDLEDSDPAILESVDSLADEIARLQS